MRYLIGYLFLLLLPKFLSAQPYVEGGNTRHRFAQLLVGADMLFFPASGGTFQIGADGAVQPWTPNAALVPRINLAGTHFWGHANFYVSIPIANLLDHSVPDGGQYTFSPGVETGLRLYPWRIERGKLRPFVGTAFAIADWRQESPNGTGAFAHTARFPLQGGLTWQRNNLLIELGGGYFFNSTVAYYTDRTTATDIRLPATYFWLGCNVQLETTLSAEPAFADGRTAAVVARLEERRALSGWSLAIGPSAAFVLGDAPRNEALYPAIGEHSAPGVFADLGLGYYYHPWDAHLNLAYRGNSSERSAYGQTQRLQRRALTLEAYKFLFDFHGFVPFVGPHLSREWYELTESVDGEAVYATRSQQWAPGITFGWDIRPDDLQGIILRTNLRYTPTQRIGEEGGVSFRQLEFNFIQLVWYPGRVRRMQRALE